MTNLRYAPQIIVLASLLFLYQLPHAQSLDEVIRAVEAGNVRQVTSWLDRGVDVNSTSPSGHSLLMIAARTGQRELVSLLVSRRANVRQRSAQGDTALMMASLVGDLDIIRTLITAGAELDHPGWTPLHYAAFEGRAPAVQLLLEKGADKDALAPNGYTALMLAARNGKAEAAKMLLYADPDVNHRTEKGETALAIARQKNMREVEELIRRAGGVE